MSDEFPDLGNLFGYDVFDPLGIEEYLKKKKEEEDQKKAEEARIAQEQESNRTFMGDLIGAGENLLTSTFDPKTGILGRPVSGAIRSGIDLARNAIGILPWNEGIVTDPTINEALDKTLGGGLEKLVNEPVAQMMESEFGPGGKANQLPPAALLRAGVFPDPLAGDIDRITSETVMGPQGPITTTHETTPEDVKKQIATAHQFGGAGEKLAGMAMDPNMLAIPTMPGLVSAGLFGPGMVKSAVEEAGQGEYGKAAIDALMAGAVGFHGAKDVFGNRGKPNTSEVKQSEAVNEPIREPIPEAASPINKDYERIIKEFDEKAAKGEFDLSDQLESEKVAAENARVEADYDTRLQNMTQGLLDRSRPAIQKVLGLDPELGGEGLRHIEAVLTDIPGGTPAYYRDGKMYIDRNFAKSSTAADLRDIVVHEITHEYVKSHNFGNIRPGESPLTGEEGRGIVETSEGQFIELDPKYTDPSKHTREAMEVRGRSGVSEENAILGLEDALKHDPDFVTQLNAYEGNVANLLGERFRSRRGLPDIQAPIELRSAPTRPGFEEVGAPKPGAKLTKAEEIEKNSLEKFVFEQNMLLKEYADNFQNAPTEAGKKLATRNFQEAKGHLDRAKKRIAELGGQAETRAARAKVPEAIDVEAKAVSEPVEEARTVTKPWPEPVGMREVAEKWRQLAEEGKKELRETPIETKAEKVEETPTSEKVVSAPANNLRRLLEGMNLTRFNVNTLTKELKAKGLDVPPELETQLPELVKELKDRGWVNEKIGGTYTLLTAPPKMLKGVSGGKIADVTNLRGSLEESLKALGAEEPVKAPETKGDYVVKSGNEFLVEGLKSRGAQGGVGRVWGDSTQARRFNSAEEAKAFAEQNNVPFFNVENVAKPTPTSTIRPGQFHFDETGRKWEVRKVEGDQVTVTSGRGGGERTQVLSRDDILVRRGIMPGRETGLPIREEVTQEEIRLAETNPEMIPDIARRLGMTVEEYNRVRFENRVADQRRRAESTQRDLEAGRPLDAEFEEGGRYGAPSKETGLPEREPTPEEIDIDLSSLEEGGGKVEPPNLADKMKEKLTPDELQAIAKLFGTEKKRKGTSETPQEVLDAQKAALRGLVEQEKKGGEGLPPTEEVSEGGEGPKQNFDVTLSDGTTHKVRASSAEEAQTLAEEVLTKYNSSKTVDKVEPTLSTLEKAAKYEIEPVREAGAQISEQVTEGKAEAKAQAKATGEQLKYQETLRKEQVRETKELQKTEDKELTQLAKKEAAIRRAQTKEKFAEKPYTVGLSNGRVVTIRARNEKVAREVVESAIRRNKSTVTVQGVTAKPSALDEAITGAAKTPEKTGFLENPVVKVLNAIKSITFGGDVGHLLRQGKQMNADLLFSKHAKKVLDQIPVLWKLGKGGIKELESLNEKIYSDPDIKLMVDDFGMDMPGMGKGLKEEAFHGAGLAEKLPIIGKHYVERSEAVYTGGLNYLRAATAKKWIESLKKDGFSPENAPEKYHAVARAMNIISQRGEFSPAYQKLFSDASAIFGAPRAKAARLQNAFELFRGGTSGRVVRTTAAKTLAFNAGLYGLLAATTGAKFIDDPEASDFAKIRINDKITVDPWVGLGVTARTVAKLVTSKAKSPYTGKGYPVNAEDALKGEFAGGIAPGIKLVYEAMRGKDLRGFEIERLDSLLNVAPLTGKSIQELLKEGDLDEAIELSILQFMGEGVDVFNYEEARATQARLKAERGLSTGRSGRKKKRTYAFD